ncbi:MAG: hypothetical protein ACOH14_03570 [Rhodoglobus sp.]
MRRIATMAMTAVFLFAGAAGASAATSDEVESEPLNVTVPYDGPANINDSADAPTGDELESPGTDNKLDKPGEFGVKCIVCGVPSIKTFKISGPVLEQKKFVRYLTGAWAKSTGYSWSSSTTVGATVSAGLGVSATSASSNIGVSASVTKTYSITVNIAASSTRYSKLGLASNFNRYYVKSGTFQNGEMVAGTSWKYGYLHAPTRDQYLIVYYQ